MRIIAFDCGVRSLAHITYDTMTDEHHRFDPTGIQSWELFDMAKTKHHSIAQIITSLIPYLRTVDLDNTDTVIIETQPSRNIRMKSLSHSIQTFVLTKNPKIRVVFSNAGSALAIFAQKAVKGLSYTKRKHLSVACAKRVLKDSSWCRKLDPIQKKDDMTDALMHLYAFLVRTTPKYSHGTSDPPPPPSEGGS